MSDFEAFGQLIFFVLIVLGWVIKAVVEARQAKQRRAEMPDEPPPVPDDRGVRPRSQAPTREPVPTPVHLDPVRADTERLGHLEPSLAARRFDTSVASRTTYGNLQATAAAVAHGALSPRARHAAVRRRLTGGLDDAPGRDLARAGVLWSEILGPCRALRGPHRPPTAERTHRA